MSACFDLAERSGEIIRSIFDSGRLGATDKADSSPNEPKLPQAELEDPQTLADLQSQKLIIGSLRAMFPGLKVIGEEGELEVTAADCQKARTDLLDQHAFPDNYNNINIQDLIIWIDPLDGTKEYTLGMKECVTVLVGVSWRGKPVGGVVHVPFIKRTLWAVVGLGAFGSIRTAVVEQREREGPAYDRRVIATSRSHLPQQALDIFQTQKIDKIIRSGGAGSKAVLVLDGEADLYNFPSQGTKRWDTCAIDAMLKAAGGKLTDSYGDEIDYHDTELARKVKYNNTRGVLAAMPAHLHKHFILPASVTI